MRLWGTYHDYPEIDIVGDRDGLRVLAGAGKQAQQLTLSLDEPPLAFREFGDALDAVRIEPDDLGDPRICYRRSGKALIVSGSSGEIARLFGGNIDRLAAGPESKNGIPSHLHLDPTSDPERRYYAPDSAALVVGFPASGE